MVSLVTDSLCLASLSVRCTSFANVTPTLACEKLAEIHDLYFP
ncbi:hypothetical protein LTSEURB_6791 [Salmonella enterica subsp. enterica serovar Urbana str. R8-2977]|uniref:Uncharacterized protein n=1 Tax=Salmonella enterica subsp. enterica serovar Urbana str. R8-2977 TaxID=913084 RepID=G5S5I2_SALET|nr:hypothetical protein LTSEURB_6791 [Salmonella enterica subsp. enterica serovar Urbana str. R8-2977]